MAQGRSTEIIWMIWWIQTSLLPIKNSFSGVAGERAPLADRPCLGSLPESLICSHQGFWGPGVVSSFGVWRRCTRLRATEGGPGRGVPHLFLTHQPRPWPSTTRQELVVGFEQNFVFVSCPRLARIGLGERLRPLALAAKCFGGSDYTRA